MDRNVPRVERMNDTMLSWMRNGLGLAAALAVLAACADEPTMPPDTDAEPWGDAPAFATHLTCTVDVRAGSMDCGPSSPSGTVGGPDMNLIVGSQHRFVRLANDTPVMEDNQFGQLGDSTTTSSPTPVAVRAPKGVLLSGVSSGIYHSCAHGSDSKLYCWGNNSVGALGDGTTVRSLNPVAVSLPDANVLNVSAGSAVHLRRHG